MHFRPAPLRSCSAIILIGVVPLTCCGRTVFRFFLNAGQKFIRIRALSYVRRVHSFPFHWGY